MNGLRVLLLDNNPNALRLTTDMLTAEGYSVYACATCEHASRMVPLVRPRIILFHGCDGDEAAAFRALRTTDPYTPLVYFSNEKGAYEVYAARRRSEEYVRTSSGHKTLDLAVRAALLKPLETT